MKIRRYPVLLNVMWIMVEIIDIILVVLSLMKIDFFDKLDIRISNPHIFDLIFFVLMFFAILQFYTIMGHYELNRRGICFRFLFYSKHYSWKDFQYIVKLRTHQQYEKKGKKHRNKGEVFLFSIKLDKENINSINSIKDQSGKFFRLPYSEELEEMIKSNSKNYIENVEHENKDTEA